MAHASSINWQAVQKQVLVLLRAQFKWKIAKKNKLTWLQQQVNQCAPKSKIYGDKLIQQVQYLCLLAVHDHGWKAKAKAAGIHGFLHHDVPCRYKPDVGIGMKLA